ncbi:MAG TPA: hypothetical protein VGC36_04650 [Rhizomicrobium sp.]
MGASAQTAPAIVPASTTPAPADAVSDPSKIVCKTLPPLTGSRIGNRRICQSRGEWEAQEHQHQQDLAHEQERGALFSTPGN